MKKETKAYFDRAEKYYELREFSRAIEEYKKALSTINKSDEPENYAGIQNNLGNAYCDLPTGDREENLRKAIECYEKALEIRTKEAFPKDYAMTQNNLGAAYNNLPTGDREENLRKAIECYEKALEIWTKEASPQYYATTQNNLGIAYSDLPTGDREENLRKAINCYKESSEGYEKVGLASYAESMKDKIKIVEKMIVDIQEKKAAESEGNVTEAIEIEEKIDAEQTRLNIRQIFESFENKEKIFEEIEANIKRFSEYVNKNRRIDNDEPELVVLRRFNSYTPILTTMNPQSRGGGYFVNFGGYGAVIDPGFNFIQNFFETGYGIADIDAIFITHAHNDHTGDLESIITLVHEYNEKQSPESKKRISLYLNRTAYIKFAAWLDLEREIIKDMQIISEEHGFIGINDTLKVHALLAEHKDIVADKGAVGFLFDWKGRRIFFTGDSKCSKEYIEKLRKHRPVNLLILHMGETTRSEFDYNEAADLDKQCLGNHLGMIGVIRTIQAMQPDLALISEFGEEFKGNIRHVIANKLKEGLKVNILAADIRLRVKLDDNGIFCPFCTYKNYVAFENIKTSYKQCLPTSAEEINALYYYCDRHSHEELDNKLKDIFKTM